MRPIHNTTALTLPMLEKAYLANTMPTDALAS